MSNEKACQATPSATLEQHIMDPRVPKSEAEHWAQTEITRLRARVEVLERALSGIVDFCEEGHRQPYVAIANTARVALEETAS